MILRSTMRENDYACDGTDMTYVGEDGSKIQQVYKDFVFCVFFFFFQAEDGIRDVAVTGVQTCALPIYRLVLRGRAEPRESRDERRALCGAGRQALAARIASGGRSHRVLLHGPLYGVKY